MSQVAAPRHSLPRNLLVPIASQVLATVLGFGGATWLLVSHIREPVLSSLTVFSISALFFWIGLTMLRVFVQMIRYHGVAPPSRGERIWSRIEMYVALLLCLIAIASLQISYRHETPRSLRQRFIDYEKTHPRR
jgi:ABC-type dipeptide/oligopeptide/nickel transport system permease component